MDNIQRPVPQHYLSYHSQSVINKLRAGDSRLTQAAWLLITIWMLQQQSVSFQPVNHAPPPPHIESARNLLFPDQFSCRRLSMFDSQQFENQEKFVMSKQLEKTYTGSKKINETEWQMAKKVYHLNGPEEYGMSKDELNAIRKDGLVKYTMKGGTLPPIELIYESQNQIEKICQNETTFRKENGVFGKAKRPSNFYYNRYTRQIIYFDKITGEKISTNERRLEIGLGIICSGKKIDIGEFCIAFEERAKLIGEVRIQFVGISWTSVKYTIQIQSLLDTNTN